MVNGTIVLDYERAVYYPGQTVSGVFELNLSAPLTFSVLYATYLGEANVEWSETQSEKYNGQKRYKQVKYVGKEEYFKYNQSLAGGADTQLPVGVHKYPIRFQIPYNVPSSFSSDCGNITYSIRIQMLLQGKPMFDQEMVKYFEIVAPFDLNKGNDIIKQPTELDFDEVYSCCLCRSGPVAVRVRLPASGYCPGQRVPVSVDVDNKSSIEVTKMIFELVSKECYRTQQPVSEWVPPPRVVSAARGGAVLGGTRRHYTVHLPVPDIVVPNLDDCRIIDVGYFFKATIKLSGCNDDLEDESEICLGLIPIPETVDGTYVHPMAHSLPQGPIPEPDINEIQNQFNNQGMDQVNSPVMDQVNSQFMDQLNSQVMNQISYQNMAHVATGSTCYVEYKQQMTSTDPTQNYQIGFKVSYPPGTDVPQMPFNFPTRIPLNDMKFNLITPSAPPPP